MRLRLNRTPNSLPEKIEKEKGPLEGGLDDVFGDEVPDEVHERKGGLVAVDVSPVRLLVPGQVEAAAWIMAGNALMFAASSPASWLDREGKDDANDDCCEAGDKIIGQAVKAQTPGGLSIQRSLSSLANEWSGACLGGEGGG